MMIEPTSFTGISSLQSTALKGTRDSLERFNQQAEAISRGDIDAANMIGLREESLLYSMNLQLIRITDEMIGQTLDMLA